MKERILGIVSLFLALCTNPSNSLAQAQDQGPADSFRIGVLYSKSGRLAPYSQSVSKGAKLAINLFRSEHPELQSNVQMIAADDESSIAGASRAATRLLAKQKVDILIGSFTNILNLPILALSKHHQIPLLMPKATDTSLVGQDTAFTLSPDDYRQGQLLAQFISKHLRIQQIGIILESERPDNTRILEGVLETWTREGGLLAGQWEFKPGHTSLGELFKEIVQQKPAALLFLGSVEHAPLMLDRAKQHGLTIPWIGGDGWDEESLRDLPTGLATPYFFSYFHRLDPLPSVQAFAQAYYEAYNVFPDPLAAAGFEATKLALEAHLKQVDQRRALLTILREESFQSLLGAARFSHDNVLLQAKPFLQTKDGKFKLINRVILQD